MLEERSNKIPLRILNLDREKVITFFSLVILVSITLLAYKGLFNSFFEQDEWYSFGKYLYAKSQGGFSFITDILKYTLTSGHFTPLTRVVAYFNFLILGINFKLYALESLFLHCLNFVLVFIFLTLLTKRKSLSFLGATFFAISSVSYQAVTWIGTFVGTQGATLFALLSLIFFVNYLEEKKRKFFYWSIISLIISLGFKESGLFLFLFLPFLDYIKKEKEERKITPFIKSHLILLVLAFVFFMIKFTPFLKAEKTGLLLGGESQGFFPKIIYNCIFNPLKAISQIFINPALVYEWAYSLTKLKYPHLLENLYVQQTIVSEYIVVLLSIIILLFLVGIYKYILKKETEKKLLIISLSFIFLSTLPYIVLEQATYPSSRYYYLTAVGAGLLFGVVSIGLVDFLNSKLENPFLKIFVSSLFLLFLTVPYFYSQAGFIRQETDFLTEIGNVRKNILGQIMNTYSVIGKKTVFYTESNSIYYGQAENIMPFQSGLGQTLMVLYTFENQLSPKFFAKDFLWGLLEQGYQEIGEQGFGFYRDYDKLVKTVEDNELKPENVLAFSWDGKRNQLSNITESIREKIEDDTKKYVLTKDTIIKGDIEFYKNKKFFGVNFDKGINRYTQDNNKIVVYKDGIEFSYGGAYLQTSQKGTGEFLYSFENQYEGYELGCVAAVDINGNYEEFNVSVKDNLINIIFNRPIGPEETLNTNFGLNGKGLVYKENSLFKYVLEAKNIIVKGDGGKDYRIPLPNILKSLRHLWVNEKERYVAFGYGDEKMIKIKDWKGFDTKILEITLEEPLSEGEEIVLPILVLSQLDKDEEIIYKYRSK